MGVVATGTVFGQLSVMLAIPVITRLYTPEQFGFVTLITSYVGLLATTVALHYELAIPLPSSPRSAFTLTVLALGITLAQATIVAAILPAIGSLLFGNEWQENIGLAAYWWPVVLGLTGTSTVFNYRAVRAKRFGAIGASRGLQGAIQAVCQVVSGAAGLGWTWLLASQAAGLLIGLVPLMHTDADWKQGFHTPRTLRLAGVARRYSAFPLASAPSSLLNSGANHLPAILLAWAHGPATAAMYGLAMRILLVPARLMGQAVSQVVLGHASDANRAGQLSQNVAAMASMLFMMSSHIFVPIGLLAGPLFRVAFGNEWAAAAVYGQCLTPWLLNSFVATPLSMLVTVLGQQQRELQFQILLVGMLVLALLTGAAYDQPVLAIAVLGTLGGIVHGLKTRWLLRLAGCNAGEIFASAARETILVTAVYLPLVIATSSWSDRTVLALAAPLALAFEWVNFRYRRRK